MIDQLMQVVIKVYFLILKNGIEFEAMHENYKGSVLKKIVLKKAYSTGVGRK